MPSDANGVYTLPAGYLAVNAETIEVSQHNPPLEDIETALTARLMRSGAAPMTGPLKLDDGTSSAPSLTLASDPSSGFYANPGVSGGMRATNVLGTIPVGFVGEFAGADAPDGWLLCYGQAISRSTYAELFTAIGTTHGVGDGSTTFNVPDYRGRVGAGQDDMGGTSANRLTGADDGLNGDTLGATGGGETQTLVTANLPAYTPSGTNSLASLSANIDVLARTDIAGGGGQNVSAVTGGVYNTEAPVEFIGSIPFTGTAQGGTSTAFGVVQPTIILNKIIFAGV